MSSRLMVSALVLVTACGGGSERSLIQNTGSDTMLDVAQAWAERYQSVSPTTAVAVSGGGSGTGIASMINGTVDIANASRVMSAEEIEAARANGHDPIEHIVGYDALAVFLHPNNPISSFTLAQLGDIYAEGGTTESWSDLGVTVPGCDSGEIIRVTRQNSSGTYAYFQEAALGERDYKLGARAMNGSSEVVDLVSNTPCAIGYSGLAYATSAVKMPCVASGDGAECVTPSMATASDRTYPISRPLFMYTSGQAEGAVADYLNWIMSDPGQCILLEIGYAPFRQVTCG